VGVAPYLLDANNADRPEADLNARLVREVIPLRERLCRHAFGLTRDHHDAEDLVQETMLKACSAFQSFQSGTNLKAWLLRIMINSHINHCRRARRHPVLYSVGELTDRQLAQVSDAEGLSYKEIAALTEIPYGTVVSRLHRGRQRLHHLLGATVPAIA